MLKSKCLLNGQIPAKVMENKIPRCIDRRILRGIVNYFNFLRDICGVKAEFPKIHSSTKKERVGYRCISYFPKSNEIWVNPFKWRDLSKKEQKLHLAGEIGHAIRTSIRNNIYNGNTDKISLKLVHGPGSEMYGGLLVPLSDFHDLISRIFYLNLNFSKEDVQNEISLHKNSFKKENWNDMADNLIKSIDFINVNATGDSFERGLKAYALAYVHYLGKEEAYENPHFIMLEDSLLHIAFKPALKFSEDLLNGRINEEDIGNIFCASKENLEKELMVEIPSLKRYIKKKIIE